jgi:hypothetical protein
LQPGALFLVGIVVAGQVFFRTNKLLDVRVGDKVPPRQPARRRPYAGDFYFTRVATGDCAMPSDQFTVRINGSG